MLTHWYFSCCIGNTTQETYGLLSALATFENVDSDIRTLRVTLDELRRSSLVSQLYAVPSVLVLQNDIKINDPILTELINDYLDQIIRYLPSDAEQRFSVLNSGVREKCTPSALYKYVNNCLEILAANEQLKLQSETPYADLIEFMPEFLLIAIVENQIRQRGTNFVTEFSRLVTSKQEDSLISAFIRHALDDQYGRLPFLIGLRVALLVDPVNYSREQLGELIRRRMLPAAQFEPDLLMALAELQYSDEIRDEQNKEITLKRIFEEVASLRLLRRLIPDYHQLTDMDRLPLSRIGITNNESNLALVAVYWQLSLWALALRIDVQRTSKHLSEIWLPPEGSYAQVQLTYPRQSAEGENWKKFHDPLVALKGYNDGVRFSLGTANTFSTQFATYVLSPWLRYQRDEDRFQSYYSDTSPVALIRLAISALYAIQILQNQPTPMYETAFSMLIIHAASVFSQYDDWFFNYVKTGYKPHQQAKRLPVPLTVLMTFCNRRIDMAGQGLFASVEIGTFVTLLRRYDAITPQEKRAHSTDEQVFYKVAVPDTILNWIVDVMPNMKFLDPLRGGRWRSSELIEEVYRYYYRYNQSRLFERNSNIPKRQVIEYSLLVRFMLPNSYADILPVDILDWRQLQRNDKPLKWGKPLNPRLLLLSKSLAPDQWDPRWNDPESPDLERMASFHLVRALERMASLEKANSANQEKYKHWLTDWEAQLDRNVGSKMDRFIRLRLLELLDSPVLASSIEAQERLAFTLLEHSSPFELTRLLEIVYPDNDDGISLVRAKLQETVVGLLYHEAEGLREQWKSRSSIQDPQRTLSNYERIQVIESFFSRIANPVRTRNQVQHLRILLAQLIYEGQNSMVGTQMRVVSARIRLGDNPMLVFADAKIPPQPWLLSGAVINAGLNKASVYFNELDQSETFDYTAETFDKVVERIHAASEPIRVLGMVREVKKETPAALDTIYVFDCGFGTITGQWSQSQEFEQGDIVSIPVIKGSQEGEPITAAQDSVHHVTLLELRSRADDVQYVIMTNEPTNSGRQLVIQSEDGHQLPFEQAYWNGDISYSYSLKSGEENLEKPVLAIKRENGNWEPYDRDLSLLLMEEFKDDSVCVLTLIADKVLLPFGIESIRFSSRPGFNYVLALTDFDENVVDTLKQELSRYSLPAGLLVTVAPITDRMGNIKLTLVTSQPHHLRHFTNLNVPFDGRNIQWRNLFDRHSVVEAERRGAFWFAKLPEAISGFPDELKIKWGASNPTADDQQELVQVIDQWDEKSWSRNELLCDYPKLQNISYDDNANSFLKRWLNIESNRNRIIVTLAGARNLKITGKGYLDCITTEQIPILVEFETLTMLLVKTQSPAQLAENRKVLITYAKWLEPVHLTNIPKDALPFGAIQESECRGMVIGIWKINPETFRLKVLWEVSGDTVTSEFNCDRLKDTPIPDPGFRIDARRSQNQWSLSIRRLNVIGKGLWTLNRNYDRRSKIHYLGRVDVKGSYCGIAEIEPGRLCQLDEEDISPDSFHLTVYEREARRDILRPNWKTFDTFRQAGNWEGKDGTRRSILKSGDMLLPGECAYNTPTYRSVILQNVQIKLTPARANEDMYIVRRIFDLIEDQRSKPALIEKSIDSSDERLQAYQQFLDSDRDVAAIWSGEKLELCSLSVPTDPDMKQWTKVVPLSLGEEPYIGSVRYSNEVLVHLTLGEDYQWQASFRLVKPFTPEQFRTEILNEDFDRSVHLAEVLDLYFVKVIHAGEIDPVTGTACEQANYLLEWGPGKTFQIPEHLLLFKGETVHAPNMAFYFGDQISRLRFHRRAADSNNIVDDSNTPTECVVNFESINIRFSHQLYDQRKKGYLHLLHLVADENNLRIRYIDGVGGDRYSAPNREYEVPEAQIKEEHKDRLLARLRSERRLDEGAIVDDLRILGRMDAELYQRSGGAIIEFEHVRFSFNTRDHRSTLKSNELVLVQAGSISPTTKSTLLALTAWGLEREDIGDDMRNQVIFEHNFSVDVTLLRSIFDKRGADALKDSIFFVRVSDTGRNKFLPLNAVPSRRIEVLTETIRANGGHIYALVDSLTLDGSSPSIRLELQPGVYVHLQKRKTVDLPSDLQKGAVVQVSEVSTGKFKLVQATFAESSYFTGYEKPSVIFPSVMLQADYERESAKHDQPTFWHNARFIVPEFPNINIQIPARTEAFDLGFCNQLMNTAHPALATVRRGNGGGLYIVPLSKQIPAGQLESEASEIEVRFAPLGDSTERTPLEWNYLTFGNESVKAIKARIKREYWSHRNPSTAIIYKHDVFTGPLFFQVEEQRRVWKLRYDSDRWLDFGYPVTELLRTLKQPGTHRYPVVGLSDRKSLWLELAPGRIVELPLHLVAFWLGGNTRHLNNFNWDIAASGDTMELELLADNVATVQSVVLRDWKFGPHKAFGPKRAVIPVGQFDGSSGGLHVGKGIYAFELPASAPFNQQTMVLYPDNTIESAHLISLEPSDVVLAGVNEANQLTILGYEDLQLVPTQAKRLRELEPLADLIFADDPSTTVGFIQGLGGALAVTVEQIESPNRIVYSTRHQRTITIQSNSRLIAQVAGYYRESGLVVLCSGGGLFTIPLEEFIYGLPTALAEAAVQTLQEQKTSIWLRTDRDRTIQMGFSTDHTHKTKEINVEAIAVVQMTNETGEQVGLICRSQQSMRFYWLPASHAAWAQLNSRQMQDVFINNQTRKFRIVLIEEDDFYFGSIVDLPVVRKELSSLDFGQETSVTIINRDSVDADGNTVFLVASRDTHTILRCVARSQEQPKQILSEVVEISKNKPYRVTMMPLGERQIQLDLPKWMQSRLLLTEAADSDFSQYMQWQLDWLAPEESDRFLLNCETGNILQDRSALNLELTYSFKLLETQGEINDPRVLDSLRQIVQAWINQYFDQPELELLYALMVILLLNHLISKMLELGASHDLDQLCASWNRVISNIGRRALRSIHVEVLFSHWLSQDKINVERIGSLWTRLNALLSKLHHQATISTDGVNSIRQFVRSANMRSRISPDEDLLTISDCFAAAIGELSTIERLRKSATVIPAFIELYRRFSFSPENLLPLPVSLKEALFDMHSRLTLYALNITLLEPLPDYSEQSSEE